MSSEAQKMPLSRLRHVTPACSPVLVALSAAAMLGLAQSRSMPGEYGIHSFVASLLGSPPEVDLKFSGDAYDVTSLIICVVVSNLLLHTSVHAWAPPR